MQNRIPAVMLENVLRHHKALPVTTLTGFLRHPLAEAPVMHLLESIALATLVRHRKPLRILEIGTASGSTTALLALNAPQAKVVTVDLDPVFQGDYTRQCLNRRLRTGEDLESLGIQKGRIEQLLVDPGKPLSSYESLQQSFDLILVDGDHTRSGVQKDTEYAVAHLEKGGAILWHDYYPLPSYIEEPEKRGVYPVLQELAQKNILPLRQLVGTCFVMGAADLPDGFALDPEKLRHSEFDKNLRVKHLYGNAWPEGNFTTEQ